MNPDRAPSEISNAAAAEIGALNHKTLNPGVFTQPVQVSDTAFGISTALERLPQSLDQVEAALIRLKLEGRLRLASKRLAETRQEDIDSEVAAAASAMSEARRHIRQAHTAMREATNVLANLGGLWEDEETA